MKNINTKNNQERTNINSKTTTTKTKTEEKAMKNTGKRLFAGMLAALVTMSSFAAAVPASAEDFCCEDCMETEMFFEETNFSTEEFFADEFVEEAPAEEFFTEEAPVIEFIPDEVPAEAPADEWIPGDAFDDMFVSTVTEETFTEDMSDLVEAVPVEAFEDEAETTAADEETTIAADETAFTEEENTEAAETEEENVTEETVAAEETAAEETAAQENTEAAAAEETTEETTTEETTEEETPAEEEKTDEVMMDADADAVTIEGEAEEVKDELTFAEDAMFADDMIVEETAAGEEALFTKEDDEMLIKIAGTFTELGLDALGEAIPGGKFIIAPLKAIFGDKLGLEGEDPIEKLANAQQQNFEELKERISELNDDMEKYTAFLGNKTSNEVEKKSLRDLFQALSSNTKDLSIAINSIMEAKYSPEEKLVRIADLTNGYKGSKYTDNIRLLSNSISSTMSTKGTKIDMNMYQSILNMCKEGYLFEGEAHKEAMVTAEALTEQYLYANALLLQCENAVKDLTNLTPEQFEVIKNNPKLMNMYDNLMDEDKVIFETKQFDETVKRINKGATGFKNFSDRDVEGNRFTDKGTLNDKAVVFDIDGKTVKGSNGSAYSDIYNKQYFDRKKTTELVNYIKERTDGKTSIATFFIKNHVDMPVDEGLNNHRYIIVDPTVTKTEDSRPFNVYRYSAGWHTHDAGVYHVRETIKVIDIYDPECKVQDLVVKTWDHVDGHPWKASIENEQEYTNKFLTIGAHQATEKDNYTRAKTVNGLTIQGPRRGFSDTKPNPKAPKVSGPLKK